MEVQSYDQLIEKWGEPVLDEESAFSLKTITDVP